MGPTVSCWFAVFFILFFGPNMPKVLPKTKNCSIPSGNRGNQHQMPELYTHQCIISTSRNNDIKALFQKQNQPLELEQILQTTNFFNYVIKTLGKLLKNGRGMVTVNSWRFIPAIESSKSIKKKPNSELNHHQFIVHNNVISTWKKDMHEISAAFSWLKTRQSFRKLPGKKTNKNSRAAFRLANTSKSTANKTVMLQFLLTSNGFKVKH